MLTLLTLLLLALLRRCLALTGTALLYLASSLVLLALLLRRNAAIAGTVSLRRCCHAAVRTGVSAADRSLLGRTGTATGSSHSFCRYTLAYA